jgi:hypothetical protein
VSEDAGIEPNTVATSALAADTLTTRLDLIQVQRKKIQKNPSEKKKIFLFKLNVCISETVDR